MSLQIFHPNMNELNDIEDHYNVKECHDSQMEIVIYNEQILNQYRANLRSQKKKLYCVIYFNIHHHI